MPTDPAPLPRPLNTGEPVMPADAARADLVLVRCGKQMLADLADNGMSEPIVLIGITPQFDGTYDLILQRPSRAVLEQAIRERFRA